MKKEYAGCCENCFNVNYLFNTAGVRCGNPDCPCHTLPKTGEKESIDRKMNDILENQKYQNNQPIFTPQPEKCDCGTKANGHSAYGAGCEYEVKPTPPLQPEKWCCEKCNVAINSGEKSWFYDCSCSCHRPTSTPPPQSSEVNKLAPKKCRGEDCPLGLFECPDYEGHASVLREVAGRLKSSEEWEERFDERFFFTTELLVDGGKRFALNFQMNDIKDFIRSLLQSREQQAYAEGYLAGEKFGEKKGASETRSDERKKLKEQIEGMKKMHWIGANSIKSAEKKNEGYNQALADLLNELNK